jgi:hypothetical protein
MKKLVKLSPLAEESEAQKCEVSGLAPGEYRTPMGIVNVTVTPSRVPSINGGQTTWLALPVFLRAIGIDAFMPAAGARISSSGVRRPPVRPSRPVGA